MEQSITCINCPMGCRMTVTVSPEGKVVSVSGNTCPRGEKYAVQECTVPVRMITAVIPVAGSEIPLSVKTVRLWTFWAAFGFHFRFMPDRSLFRISSIQIPI